MANEINNNATEMAKVENGNMQVTAAMKEHRKMKPWVKWTLVGVGGAIIIGAVAFCIVNGKKPPIDKVAEVVTETAEAAATVV